MKKLLFVTAVTIPAFFAGPERLHAQESLVADCGPVPSLPTTLQNQQSIKGQLQGQADFLSKLVGQAELSGQIGAARKQLYQNSEHFFAAQKDAYLAHVFCVLIMKDNSLSTIQKLDALATYRNSTPTSPPPPAPKPPAPARTTGPEATAPAKSPTPTSASPPRNQTAFAAETGEELNASIDDVKKRVPNGHFQIQGQSVVLEYTRQINRKGGSSTDLNASLRFDGGKVSSAFVQAYAGVFSGNNVEESYCDQRQSVEQLIDWHTYVWGAPVCIEREGHETRIFFTRNNTSAWLLITVTRDPLRPSDLPRCVVWGYLNVRDTDVGINRCLEKNH